MDLDGPLKEKEPAPFGASPHQVYAALKGTTLLSLALLGCTDGLGDPRCRFARRRLLTGSPRRPFTDPERSVQIRIKRGWKEPCSGLERTVRRGLSQRRVTFALAESTSACAAVAAARV